MNQEMLERLSVITEEEREILNGRTEIDRTRYTKGDELVTFPPNGSERCFSY